MKTNFIGYSTLFLLPIILYSCTQNRAAEQTKPTLSIPVATVQELDTTITNDFVTDIQAIKNVEIRSRQNGFLKEILVDEGDHVQQGQILFKLNDEEFRTELAKAVALLNSAKAEARQAKLELNQTDLLLEKKVVSKTEKDLAEAKLHAAEAKIEEAASIVQSAKNKINHCIIRAPFNGSIDRILLKEGSLLTEGSLITSISDNSHIYAYFDITEQQFLSMLADSTYNNKTFRTSVKLTLANGDIYPLSGNAELAESEFNNQTGTISLRAKFPNPNHMLRHGSSGKINFPVKMSEIIVVPQKSVFEIQDRTFVFKVDANNKIKMTSFEAGQRIGHYYIVKSGLTKTDKVVFEGVQSLKDGQTIKPNFINKKLAAIY